MYREDAFNNDLSRSTCITFEKENVDITPELKDTDKESNRIFIYSNENKQESNMFAEYIRDNELFQDNIIKIDSEVHLNVEITNTSETYSVDHNYILPVKKK